MKTTVYNQSGDKVKELDLNPKVFGLKVKAEVIQQAVVAQQANKRKIFAHAKDRSEVSGGGRKPWRQKGTGRARHGSSRSPIWRGGGVTFGPSKDRNFSLKINKKVKRLAILMSLSNKAIDEKIVLVDKLELDELKTKKFFEILQNLKLRDKKVKKTATKKQDKNYKKKKKPNTKSVLVVLPGKDEKIKRVTKNIPRLFTIQANNLNVVDLLKYQYLLISVDSLKQIEKTFVK